MKIAYVKQSGDSVCLFDNSNHEYKRVHGQLVSYTQDFVITTCAHSGNRNRVYDSNGRWARDVKNKL